MNIELFNKICGEVIGQQQGTNGIGTLSEKTVHSVIKNYLSPNRTNHEQKINGFVADIFCEVGIIEIQTRGFDKLRRKLSAFLLDYPVTIVYPIHNMKWIRWVNPQTGEVSPPRKSPKSGSPYTIFPELYKIKNFLTNPNLQLKIIQINLEEYRFLDGWSKDFKKGSTPIDRLPTELVQEINVSSTKDYRFFLPDELPINFTSKDFKNITKVSISCAQTTLNILFHVGIVKRIGKKGNSYLYTRNSELS